MTTQQEILDAAFVLPSHLLEPFNSSERVERCGILMGYRTRGRYCIEQIVEVENEAHDPSRSFAITRRSLRTAVADNQGFVLGVFHTHWASTTYPSIRDVKSIPIGWIGVVYHVPTRTVTFYNRHGFIKEGTT